MSTRIVYFKEHSKHDNSSHPENSKRLEVMLREIKNTPFYNDLDFVQPDMLSEKKLYMVHSEDMVQHVKNSCLRGGWLTLDTYVCEASYEIARLAAGGMVQITRDVLDGKAENGFALIRPPGHHATRTNSMGFCLFNNIALAAEEIAQLGKKILIFDPDVHHGNGTQETFYDRKDVLYQSFHLFPHYPGTGHPGEIGMGAGEGYTINAPLSHGNGNQAVTKLMNQIFIPIANQFRPDIILFSVGYDSHHYDMLGGLRLTTNFYGEMIAQFQRIQPKIVCTLEGGYNLDWIGKCLVSQLGQMTLQPVKFKDQVDENTNVDEVIANLKSKLSEYWKI